jgi:hypothetical protein
VCRGASPQAVDDRGLEVATQGIDAQGNPTTGVLMHIYDGQAHPSTGSPYFDASAYTRVDANTVIFSRSKAGKLVMIGTNVVSPDGKTLTVTSTVTAGRGGTDIAVFDKQ